MQVPISGGHTEMKFASDSEKECLLRQHPLDSLIKWYLCFLLRNQMPQLWSLGYVKMTLTFPFSPSKSKHD